jgi:hypothetical protein
MNNRMQKRWRTARFKSLLTAVALLAGMGVAATASATAILSASVGGAPTGADYYETFDSLALGTAGGLTPSGITVSFSPSAQAVQGSASGTYAAPYLSGNNGFNFGGQPDGADTTTYLSSGSTGAFSGAGATLAFPGLERYMGLLWGSVDKYNTLTFFNGAAEIATFTGADVSTLANGDQGASGTFYVNINFSTPFDRVVAPSSSYAFEFDNVAFSANPIGVPEPGVAGMFALGLLLLGSGYWLRKRERRLG